MPDRKRRESISVDKLHQDLLSRFSQAFNSNVRETTRSCVTEDFEWIYYEGPDRPNGNVLQGVDQACDAVAARAARLSTPIEFSDSEEFPCGDRLFVTYRATGAFHDSGPFDVRAIDIYTFRGERLRRKDTYWKIIEA